MTMNQTNEFETYLKETVLEKLPSRTKEAMCYSLMNGGKRVRPQLLFALYNIMVWIQKMVLPALVPLK